MKNLVFKTIAVLMNLFVVLLAVEVYVRVKQGDLSQFKAREMQYRRADFRFDHSFIPGAKASCVTQEWDVPYSINSMGFRDHEYGKKPAGTFRVLMIGDSYTEGYGVKLEDSFIKVLEKELNDHDSSKKYEVVNGAIASYSPLLEYIFISQKALSVEPDVVVLVYDYGDLKDDYEYEKTTTFENGLPVKATPYQRAWTPNATAFQRFLIRHFRAYLYLDNKLNKMAFKWQNRQRQFQNEYTDETPHDSFIVFRPGQEENVKKLWVRNEKYLDLIHRHLKERGIPLVLVSYPYGIQLGAEEWSEGRLTQGFKTGVVYPQPEHVHSIEKFCQERDIPFVNLYDGMAARYSFPLQYKFDGHLNPKGHRLMGEVLYEELVKRKVTG